MPSLVEVIGEALQHYWLSPFPLTVLAVCGASIGTLLYVFLTNARNAKLRVSLLTGLYALSIFFWVFIAVSLVLCVSQVRMVESEEPLAMAIGGTDRTILVSRGMVSLLERDEAETVVAHEVMHLKHHDAEFKVFSRVLSRILFFDPFSKFFDPAVHREREYLADEMGARSSGRPAALASALLKIASRGVPQKASWGLSILGPARGVFRRYPPLQERVNRLLLLSDLLGSRGVDGAKT